MPHLIILEILNRGKGYFAGVLALLISIEKICRIIKVCDFPVE